MGNLSQVMPSLQVYGCGGITGAGHGADYQVADPQKAVVLPAMVQVGCAVTLLKDGAARAREVLADCHPDFPDKESLLKTIYEICTRKEPIRYEGKTAKVFSCVSYFENLYMCVSFPDRDSPCICLQVHTCPHS